MSTLLIASRYLFGRKLRAFLTTLAIVFGVFVIFGMNTLIPTFIDAFMSSAISASGQVDVSITQKTDDSFSRRTLDKVATAEGVKVAAGFLKRTVNLPENYVDDDSSVPDEIAAVTLVGLDNDALRLHSYDLAAGRFIRPSDDDRAVITTTLAEAFHVGLGDTFKLPTTVGTIELTVTGLLPARAIPGNEEVIVSLYEAQKLLDMEGQINVIEANLTTTDEAARAQIVTAIETKLGRNFKVGAITTGSDLLSNLAVAQIAFSMFGVFALLMGGFIIFNTFRTIVAERRHDIGVLRSIGASRRTIISLILAEGLLQGIVGTVIGIVIGYILSVLILTALAPIYKSFIHLTLKTTPVVPPSLVFMTVLVGLGVTLLAGLLPALSASRVSPLEALRPSVAETIKRRRLSIPEIAGIVLVILALAALITGNVGLAGLGVLMFLAGLILVSPALLDPIARVFGSLVALVFAREGTGSIAQANLSRQPGRAAITASATMIGLAIIVAMAGMITSLEGAFINVLRTSLGSDYLLTPPALSVWDDNVGSNADFADRLRDIRGVEAVSTLRVASSEVKGQALSVMGIDPENFPKVSALTFTGGDPNLAYSYLAAGRTVIFNGIIASRIGVKVGDDVRILTPTGSTVYRVIGIGGDYLNAKLPTAYISQANLAKDFRKDEDIFIQLNLEKGADPARVELQIKKIMADYPQFKMISGREFFESNKVLMQQSFIGVNVMMWLLAIPSLIAMVNTLAIAVIERTREIGMMRATGATRRQVSTTILAEAVLLASVGTVLGVSGGLYLGYVLVSAMAFAGYPATYYFPTDGVIAAIVAGLVFGAIAAVIPARQAARLKIIQALQYE